MEYLGREEKHASRICKAQVGLPWRSLENLFLSLGCSNRWGGGEVIKIEIICSLNILIKFFVVKRFLEEHSRSFDSSFPFDFSNY